MKIKLDENLPRALLSSLMELGHDVDTVPQEGIAGADDKTVWHEAQLAKRFLITQDLDFSDIRQFAPGAHAGILLVRMRQPGRLALLGRIHQVFVNEDISDWMGCFVVLSDYKLRIVRPKT